MQVNRLFTTLSSVGPNPSAEVPLVSDIAEINRALDARSDMSAEALSSYIHKNFKGNSNGLKTLEPFVREIKRRFKNLPRKRNVDGTRPTIGGETCFSRWCLAVLDKNVRTVNYMLAGGNKNRAFKKDIPATQERMRAYLEKFLKSFKHDQQREIATHLVAFLESEGYTTEEES